MGRHSLHDIQPAVTAISGPRHQFRALHSTVMSLHGQRKAHWKADQLTLASG